MTQVNSPNWELRPENMPIELLVVHGISLPPGEFGGSAIDALFTNSLNPAEHPYFELIAGHMVSAHCLVRRGGEIVQYVSFNNMAWHAGVSAFQGRVACNDFSIGIELEGTDEIPYTQAQYKALAKLIKLLQNAYPLITKERIVGHSDIAPGRKTDPGPAFDWLFLKTELNHLSIE